MDNAHNEVYSSQLLNSDCNIFLTTFELLLTLYPNDLGSVSFMHQQWLYEQQISQVGINVIWLKLQKNNDI